MSNKLGFSTEKGFHKPDGTLLKFGDFVIPHKKLLMDTPVSIKLDAGKTKIYSSATSIKDKILEVVFQGYSQSNESGVYFKFRVGSISGSSSQMLLRSSSSMGIAVATFGVDEDTDLYVDVDYDSSMSTTVPYKILKIYEIIE